MDGYEIEFKYEVGIAIPSYVLKDLNIGQTSYWRGLTFTKY